MISGLSRKGLLRPLGLGIALTLAAHARGDTLRDIYDLAMKNDPKLRAAAATFRADRETEVQARSRLLPQVNARASLSYTHRPQDAKGLLYDPSAAPFPVALTNQTSTLDAHDRTWGVSLTQPLFDLPAWFSFQSGKQLTEQARAQFSYEQQNEIVRVADAYFSVLRAWDNLQAAKAEERATKRQLDQTQQRYDVGLIAITDVQEARAAYDATIAKRLIEEGNLARAHEALAAIIGRTPANLWRLNKDFPITQPTPTSRDAWVNFAMQNNYALKAALYGMQAAEENATAKRLEYLPKVTGSLSYQDDSLRGTQAFNPDALFPSSPDARTKTSAATLSITMPLFTGGYNSSVKRQAAERYNAALDNRNETERTVVQATRSDHIAVETDVQRVKAGAQSIVSAQSALDATNAGYKVGTRNVVDVLQAQRTLYNAARDYANARYDYLLDTLRLKQQAGTLSPQDIYDLNKWLVAPEAPSARTFENFNDNSALKADDDSADDTAPSVSPPAPAKPRHGKPR